MGYRLLLQNGRSLLAQDGSALLLQGGASALPGCPLEAVQAFWTASASLRSLTSDGELYHPEAPQGTELPYVTVSEVSDTVSDRTTGSGAVRHVSLQFNCLASTDADAKSMGRSVAEAFDRSQAGIGGLDGWGLRLSECNSGLLTKGEGFAPGGKTCFIQTADLDLFYSRA